MKTTAVTVIGIAVLMAAITNRVSVNAQLLNAPKNNSVNMSNGSYLASEYAKFKIDNGLTEVSSVAPASEKVLFKAFIEEKRKTKH